MLPATRHCSPPLELPLKPNWTAPPPQKKHSENRNPHTTRGTPQHSPNNVLGALQAGPVWRKNENEQKKLDCGGCSSFRPTAIPQIPTFCGPLRAAVTTSFGTTRNLAGNANSSLRMPDRCCTLNPKHAYRTPLIINSPFGKLVCFLSLFGSFFI